MLSALLNGLATGMLLQLAIGPVFLYVAGLTVQQTTAHGIAAVIAVTVVDYLFIVLAILGVGKLLERERIKKTLGIGSSIVLMIFGFMMLYGGLSSISTAVASGEATGSLLSSFTKAFVLTASSPLTILFWTGIFTARSIEKGFNQKQLWVFGLAAGVTTPLFLGSAVLVFSLLRSTVSFSFTGWLNMGVGMILMSYGILRLFRLLRENENQKNQPDLS
ncbi:MAG: LysE family transporter [Bacillota bacterium]|nr:LysE family transporter [Bacillota bacterium]MDW7676180.1 LysE family transporter [Bacillota bacterium]